MYEEGDLIYLSHGTTDIVIKAPFSSPPCLLANWGIWVRKVWPSHSARFLIPTQSRSECWKGPASLCLEIFWYSFDLVLLLLCILLGRGPANHSCTTFAQPARPQDSWGSRGCTWSWLPVKGDPVVALQDWCQRLVIAQRPGSSALLDGLGDFYIF